MPRPSQDPEFTGASTVDGEGRSPLELDNLAHQHEDTVFAFGPWVVVNDVDRRCGSGISQKTILCDGLQRVQSLLVPLLHARDLIRNDSIMIRAVLIECIHHVVTRHIHTAHRSVPFS